MKNRCNIITKLLFRALASASVAQKFVTAEMAVFLETKELTRAILTGIATIFSLHSNSSRFHFFFLVPRRCLCSGCGCSDVRARASVQVPGGYGNSQGEGLDTECCTSFVTRLVRACVTAQSKRFESKPHDDTAKMKTIKFGFRRSKAR